MRSRTIRIALIVLGLLVAAVGAVAWASEAEYGSARDFSVRVEGAGAEADHVVFEADEEGTEREVFRGTRPDALAYTRERRSEGRSFVVPALVIAAGAGLLAIAFLPLQRDRSS